MSMFKDVKLIDAEGTLDLEVLEIYITEYLGGVIGEDYSEPQGRITFINGSKEQMFSAYVNDACFSAWLMAS